MIEDQSENDLRDDCRYQNPKLAGRVKRVFPVFTSGAESLRRAVFEGSLVITVITAVFIASRRPEA
jgi:hypothetical protein